MDKKLVFIVGIQKSGTSLLFRMLQETEYAENPFKNEGHDFWGNVPPFSPKGFPAGTIYQRSGGDMGHEIDAEDAAGDIQRELHRRLAGLKTNAPVIVNKNPYNTVRLPWLRKLFPDSIIIGMVRRAVPNVYSLLKKFYPHKDQGMPPEDGWWGIKPKGWRQMVSGDKLAQSSLQWRAINNKLWLDRRYLDMLIGYHSFCASPVKYIEEILSLALSDKIHLTVKYPPIKCFDSEYQTGSCLMSKNRYYRKTGTFETPPKEPIEVNAFSKNEISRVNEICGDVEKTIDVLT